MTANYEKPMIEFEEFELNTAIASGCSVVVNLGPGDLTHTMCTDYGDAWVVDKDSYQPGDKEDPAVVNFYEDDCDCYLSATGSTLFTS